MNLIPEKITISKGPERTEINYFDGKEYTYRTITIAFCETEADLENLKQSQAYWKENKYILGKCEEIKNEPITSLKMFFSEANAFDSYLIQDRYLWTPPIHPQTFRWQKHVSKSGIPPGGVLHLTEPIHIVSYKELNYSRVTTVTTLMDVNSAEAIELAEKQKSFKDFKDYGKRIPIRDLKRGYAYVTKGNSQAIFAGRMAGKLLFYSCYHSEINDIKRGSVDTHRKKTWSAYVLKRSHSFSTCLGKVIDPEKIKEFATEAYKTRLVFCRDAIPNLEQEIIKEKAADQLANPVPLGAPRRGYYNYKIVRLENTLAKCKEDYELLLDVISII
ncbi:MAG: hypothetical protein HQL68_12710 [Magnetococcales bacterium]|nr:hypothetical protein [Magnetococcales bacterium]